MASTSGVHLQELVLSSSSFLTALHDAKTGSLLTAFKQSSTAGSSSGVLDAASLDITTAGSKGKARANETSTTTATWRQLADVVEGRDGQGGIVVAALPGGKGALNVWSFQRVSLMIAPRTYRNFTHVDFVRCVAGSPGASFTHPRQAYLLSFVKEWRISRRWSAGW